jgi:hypothetical protein
MSFCAGVAQCVVVKMEIVAHVNGAGIPGLENERTQNNGDSPT